MNTEEPGEEQTLGDLLTEYDELTAKIELERKKRGQPGGFAKKRRRAAKGPRAFPMGGEHNPQRGMTIRDWFAGQALASGTITGSAPQYVSEMCYAVADAMLEERSGS